MTPKLQHQVMTTVLPSDGRNVRFRPMTGREEKLLLMAKETGERGEILSTVFQVVSNCVLDDVAVGEMPLFDVEWLFIRIRIASVGPTARVSYVDRADKKRYDFEVDLEKVVVVRPDGALENLRLSDEISIVLGWPTVESFLRAEVVEAESDVETAHQLAIESIRDIYDGDTLIRASAEPREELDEFISSFDMDSYKSVLDHAAAMPRLEYRIEYVNSLGKEREIVLSNLTDFFRFR